MLLLQQHSDNSVTVRPIETRAYGHRFRSRLEARWAVFFTNFGLRWEYEPEGFAVDGAAYLPDFRVWTPQGEPIWYEVKPSHVTGDQKLHRFVKALDNDYSAPRAALLNGSPREYFHDKGICPRCGVLIAADSFYDCDDEVGISCFPCDMETPGGGDNSPECDGVHGITYRPHKGWVMTRKSELRRLVARLRDASDAAMSARFEHGEAP